VLTIPPGSADERRLIKRFRALSGTDRETLLAFAEFLTKRDRPAAPRAPAEPQKLPRPPQETVVGAIKRLSASYAMLERETLLNETSALMSAHLLQGRAAAEVIDELESLFARHYAAYRSRHDPEV
jgi:hypothetical protein